MGVTEAIEVGAGHGARGPGQAHRAHDPMYGASDPTSIADRRRAGCSGAGHGGAPWVSSTDESRWSPARRAASGARSRSRSARDGARVVVNYTANEAAADEAVDGGARRGRQRAREALRRRRRGRGRRRVQGDRRRRGRPAHPRQQRRHRRERADAGRQGRRLEALARRQPDRHVSLRARGAASVDEGQGRGPHHQHHVDHRRDRARRGRAPTSRPRPASSA